MGSFFEKIIQRQKLIQRLETEGQYYDEENDLVYEIEFDLDEGYGLLTPCVVNGVRQNSFQEVYFNESTALEITKKLNSVLGY